VIDALLADLWRVAVLVTVALLLSLATLHVTAQWRRK
jgi:hypothetical protein